MEQPFSLCALIKENKDSECASVGIVYACALKLCNDLFRFLNALQYVGTKKYCQRIVVRAFPLLLHVYEARSKILDFLWKFSHDILILRTSSFDLTMLKGAIDLSPRLLASRRSGRAHQHIGATACQRMEEGIIGCADRPPQFDFSRSSRPVPLSQLLGDIQKMVRIQNRNFSWQG